MLNPHDPYLAELLEFTLRDQAARAMASGDPFHGNYPPIGKLPALVPRRVPLAAVPTGEVLSVVAANLLKNMLVVGPTGGGKTNWLRLMMGALLAMPVTIVAFDRKQELVDCRLLAQGRAGVFPLTYRELRLAMLQPVPGANIAASISVIVELLANHLNLMASRRLMLETLQILFKRPRQKGTWPTLSEWIDLIEKIRVDAVSRLGQYREAALYALKGVENELRDVVGFAASDMLERMFSQAGCFVIMTGGLSVEASSLLASLFINHAYVSREASDSGSRHPLIFVLDDALPLVRGNTAAESEGGINPLSTWAFMGRSRGIGFVVAAQNFSVISPVLRNNSDTVLCFGSYGRDAEELARHLNLDRDQAAVLPVLRPGEVVAIARSVWPLAVYGRVPEVS